MSDERLWLCLPQLEASSGPLPFAVSVRRTGATRRTSYGTAASYLLALSERLLMANNGHERAFRLRPLI